MYIGLLVHARTMEFLHVYRPPEANKSQLVIMINCAKSDYIINVGYIEGRKTWPAKTQGMWREAIRVSDKRGVPGSSPGGGGYFVLRGQTGDRLETRKVLLG